MMSVISQILPLIGTFFLHIVFGLLLVLLGTILVFLYIAITRGEAAQAMRNSLIPRVGGGGGLPEGAGGERHGGCQGQPGRLDPGPLLEGRQLPLVTSGTSDELQVDQSICGVDQTYYALILVLNGPTLSSCLGLQAFGNWFLFYYDFFQTGFFSFFFSPSLITICIKQQSLFQTVFESSGHLESETQAD